MDKKITNNIEEKLIVHSWAYFDNVFDDSEIESMCNYFSSVNTKKATIIEKENPQSVNLTTRISDIAFHFRNENTNWIFDKMNLVIEQANSLFFNYDLAGYDSFQYTEYDACENGKYDYHMDLVHGKIFPSDFFMVRKLSLIMMLNRPEIDFEGGDFLINHQNESCAEKIPFKKGRIIFFPSFMLHKVSPVTKGKRKSLVTWVVGPKFK
jgi:PKHD-type hydroxylase